MKKTHVWILLLVLVILIGAAAAVYADTIVMRIAPKVVLKEAVSNALTQLEERFFNSPMHILCDSWDSKGAYTADLLLDAEHELIQQVRCQMTVQTDAANHQLQARGTIHTERQDISLNLYLNDDFLAVSSGELLGRTEYGITYQTFSEDIRKIPLLNFAISDTTLAKWDTALKNVQDTMEKEYVLPDMPDLSFGKIRAFSAFLLALPSEVETRTRNVNGELLECQAISYGVERAKLEDSALPRDWGLPLEDLSVTFYLFEGILVSLQIQTSSNAAQMQYEIELGMQPSVDTLQLSCVDHQGKTTRIAIDTKQDGHIYSESWKVTENDKENNMMYQWNLSNKQMKLRWNGNTADCVLKEQTDGFSVESDDFVKLLALFREKKSGFLDMKAASGKIAVRRGSQIIQPAYKNLDQWSFDDFFAILGSIGALIGLNVE